MAYHSNRAITIWLTIVGFLVIFLVLFGGWVRLTRSGLSIVQWKVITGIIPPLTHEAWEREFAEYKETPEFQKINRSMTLEEYEFIYFNEYFHRLVARITGMLFVLPLFYFLWKGTIPWRKSGIYLLIGLGFAFQGWLGWYMVSSGLIDRPSVSHYRLTAHLLAALTLLGLIFWAALDNIYGTERPLDRPNRKSAQLLAVFMTAVLVIQISWGGLVAGLKAGHASSSWPLMFGRLIPPGLLSYVEPWWKNLVEVPVTVHYIHRWFAFAVLLATFLVFWVARKKGFYTAVRPALLWLLGLVMVQIALGVSVIWFRVPVWLALVHQGMGIWLLLNALLLNHRLRYAPALPQAIPAGKPVQAATNS
jgi:heme a synthase